MARDDVARELKKINSTLTGVQADIGGIKTDIVSMKTEIGGMKADIGGIKADLVVMKTDIGEIKTDIGGMKSDIGGLTYEVVAGFNRVDQELAAAKVRDEEMLGLIKLGFEARQADRESIDAKFDTVTTEIREQTDLLKSVIVHVRRRVERVEARKPRRRS